MTFDRERITPVFKKLYAFGFGYEDIAKLCECGYSLVGEVIKENGILRPYPVQRRITCLFMNMRKNYKTEVCGLAMHVLEDVGEEIYEFTNTRGSKVEVSLCKGCIKSLEISPKIAKVKSKIGTPRTINGKVEKVDETTNNSLLRKSWI